MNNSKTDLSTKNRYWKRLAAGSVLLNVVLAAGIVVFFYRAEINRPVIAEGPYAGISRSVLKNWRKTLKQDNKINERFLKRSKTVIREFNARGMDTEQLKATDETIKKSIKNNKESISMLDAILKGEQPIEKTSE